MSEEKEKKKHELAAGKKYKVKVVDMSTEGWGIGKLGYLTVFLNEGIPAIVGDDVTVLLTDLRTNLAYGRVLEIRILSPKRRKSQCKNSEACGGCALQEMNYKSQMVLKRHIVKSDLKRIGKIQNPEVKPVIKMKDPRRYRNKAQFAVGPHGEIGFFKLKSHEVVDCKVCTIQNQAAVKIADVMRRYVKSGEISAYDPDTGVGLLRHVIVRVGATTGEVMVILVIHDEKVPKLNGLVEKLEEGLGKLKEFLVVSEEEEVDVRWRLKSVVVNFNCSDTSLIMGEKNVTVHGEDRIVDVFDGLLFEISPDSFFQVNPRQRKELYDTAIRYAALTGRETVADVYCGVGSITMHIAHLAKHVIGIESEASAVDDAWRNAALNGLKNTKFICDKAEFALPILVKKGIRIQSVILDPPSRGCKIRLLEAVAATKSKRIVYISCNTATLARDIKILQELNYEFKEAQPVDMFPQTMSIECVALLEYKGTVTKKGDKDDKEDKEINIHADRAREERPQSCEAPEQALKRMMEEKGLTLKSLAVRTGVTLKRVNDILTGQREVSKAYAKLLEDVFADDENAAGYWAKLKIN